jgi:hypothetical protein
VAQLGQTADTPSTGQPQRSSSGATRAMTKRVDAAAVLIKPFSRDCLLTAIRQGLNSDKDPSRY